MTPGLLMRMQRLLSAVTRSFPSGSGAALSCGASTVQPLPVTVKASDTPDEHLTASEREFWASYLTTSHLR